MRCGEIKDNDLDYTGKEGMKNGCLVEMQTSQDEVVLSSVERNSCR